jgi:hypothetical protein
MRITELKPEILSRSVEYLEKVYSEEGIKINPSSWVKKYLEITRKMSQGYKYKNRNLAFNIATIIVFLSEDIEECKRKNVELGSKLEESIKINKISSRLHEISVMAALQRKNIAARFIKEKDVKTPDIELIEKGVIECKVARSPRKVVPRLKEAAEQMMKYPGQKFADIFLLFPITSKEIDEFGRFVANKVDEKMLDVKNIFGLHGFGLRFLEQVKLDNGHDAVDLKGWGHLVNDQMSDVWEIIRAFDEE